LGERVTSQGAEAFGVEYPVSVVWLEHGDGVVVDSREQLARLLDRIAAESSRSHPPLVQIGNEGGVLTIGLGAPVSTLNHVPPTGDPPYMICVGDGDEEDLVDFFCFGHHSQYAARNTIPKELARAAALEYAESGMLPDSVTWESV
jgi:hypothetical protein